MCTETAPSDGGVAECEYDFNCAERPYGACLPSGLGHCACHYGCVVDSDCERDEVCDCGANEPGRCVRAACRLDGDCPGSACYLSQDACGARGYFCGTLGDACEAGTFGCIFNEATGRWQGGAIGCP